MTKLQQQLQTLDACDEAFEWVGKRTLKTAWIECERADWMLWLAARVGVDRRLVVKAAVDCALSVLHLTDNVRVSNCLDTLEAWCAGEATTEEVIAARDASHAAARDASHAAARDASHAASHAYAYAAAADAYAAAADAAYADADYARAQALLEMADLVRERITWRDVSDALDKAD